MALNGPRFRWHARVVLASLQKLGWLGAVGAVLVIAALVLRLTAISELDAQRGALQAEAEKLQLRHRTAQKAPITAAQRPARQLDTFYEFFPPIGTLQHWMLKLYGAADKHGLALDAGDYKLVQEKGRRLARYQITLPMKGSYDQIRGFMNAVLNDIPAAALESVGLQRDAIGSAGLNASVKLTLFLRMENW